MSDRVERLVRAGIRRGWRRGVVDGNRAWVLVGGLSLLAHLYGRWGRRREQVVFSERLSPGERFVVTHEPLP